MVSKSSMKVEAKKKVIFEERNCLVIRNEVSS